MNLIRTVLLITSLITLSSSEAISIIPDKKTEEWFEPVLDIFRKKPEQRPASRLERPVFEAGDIVSCMTNLHGNWRRQWALATAPSNHNPKVIYVVGNYHTRRGYIMETDWYQIFPNRVESTASKCLVEKHTVPNALARARTDMRALSRRSTYFYLGCDGKDWVYSWAYNRRHSESGVMSLCMVDKLPNLNKEYQSTKLTLHSFSDWDIGNIFGLNKQVDLILREDQCLDLSRDLNGTDFNDRASKLELTNKCVRIWSGFNCTGDSTCVCDNVQHLNKLILDVHGNHWDDRISAVSFCSHPNPSVASVKVFEHTDYIGRKQTILVSENECRSIYKGDSWYDQVSSVLLVNGDCMRVWSEPDCKGYHLDIRGDISDLKTKIWNDRIRAFSSCDYEHF